MQLFKKRTARKRTVGRRNRGGFQAYDNFKRNKRKRNKTKFSSSDWNKWLQVVTRFYKNSNKIDLGDCETTKSISQANTLLVRISNDNRPYVNVRVLGSEMIALLDSGASVSVLGSKGMYLIEKFELNVLPSRHSNISTADGTAQPISGAINLPIHLDNVLRIVEVLVVPSLEHSIILGSDFCKLFDITLDFRNNSYQVGGSHKLECSYVSSEKSPVPFVKDKSELSKNQTRDLEQIVSKFKELSWNEGETLGRTNMITHRIDTGDSQPLKQRHHNMSPYMLDHLNKELDKMLELGVVSKSCSPWASPVLLVKKASGELRFCFDGRKLNSVTKKDAYPLPHVDHILNKLSGARYLSSIDLKSAFWQIPLEESSKEKTAFVIPSRGLYNFNVMPFGLSNAAQTQQRLMETVLGYQLEPYCFVYLDDVIIATPTFEKHVEVLEEVFSRLKTANLTINLNKCEFCRPSLKYLGFLIDRQGLRTDPEKIAAMINFQRPTTVTELKRFVGIVGWYRRFIPSYSSLTSPLTSLIKGKRKSQKISWDDKAEDAFRKIKEALVTAPILASPDFKKMFTIQCDASDVGVGCVLSQEDDDGREVVIAFASRTLSDAEKKYTVTEKECLAVLFGVHKFRCYIEGTRFKVITDHHSLLWLSNLKDPCGRLARWAVKMQQYDMLLEHRKGSLNVVPDALSRAPLVDSALINLDPEKCNADPWYERMVRIVQHAPDQFSNYSVRNGLLYKHVSRTVEQPPNLPEWKLVVPKQARKFVLQECHNEPTAAHLGNLKTLAKVQELYYWPKMRTFVRRYVKRCKTCAAQKARNTARPGFMGQPKQCSFPWQMISVDTVGPLPNSTLGNKYLLMVSDYFTKFVLIHPMRQASGKPIADFLENQVFLIYGAPQVMTCDNGTEFINKNVQQVCSKYGVKVWCNARYHAQVNQVERVNRVVETAIRSYVEGDDHRRWDAEIHKIGYAIRSAVHESTGYSSTFLNFGRYVPIDGKFYGDVDRAEEFNLQPYNIDQYAEEVSRQPEIFRSVSSHLDKAYKRHADHYNKNKRQAELYNVGDRVWKKNYVLSSGAHQYSAKLVAKHVPCRIRRKVSPLVYEVEDESGIALGRWHVKDLKPYYPDEEDSDDSLY